jgi:hypothetical protein
MNTIIPGLKAALSALKPKSDASANIPVKDMGILDHIEKIVEISRKHGIDKSLRKAKIHCGYVSQKLGISPVQAVLFSHFMEKGNDSRSRILISEIAESIHCGIVRVLKYLNECEELEKKKLIRCSHDDSGISFRIPREVQDSLRKSNEFIPASRDNLSINKFFSVLEKLFEERGNNELTYESLQMELLDLINANKHLTFCKKIMSYKLDTNDLTLAVCFCHLCGNNNDDNIGTHDLKFLYDEPFMARDICDDISNGNHTLIKGKFIEYNNNDGFANTESWKLSDKAKKELLSELNGFGKKNYQKNLIAHDSIRAKTLFYNTGEAEKIEKLASLLQEKNYHKIQKRLNGKGMRQGFACLFTGSPGTGKTETVYQIARQTKRGIMLVDISQTKTCWYGESEKKIKEVFDTYRYAVENSKTAPILLFNEADAIIGKRQINNDNSRSTDKTDNRIQNIILQEIENLSGILIATTNLAQNMDGAFERRFLYKINFGKPNHESRANIWKSLLPGLPEHWAAMLAKDFDLSGGQIENIARKTEVETILSGKTMSLDTLIQYAKDEVKNSFTATTRIGFNNG